MAVAMSVGDILSVKAWCTNSDQAAVNSYNFQVVSVVGGAVTDQDLANSMDTFFSTFYRAWQPSSVRYNGVQVYFLKRSPGFTLPAAVKSITGAGAGTSGATSVPRNARAVLKYNTFTRGPSGRGRVFLPFASIANLTVLGLPFAGFNTLLNATFASLIGPTIITAGASTATVVWSVVHRGPPIDATQILAAESADAFGQQHKSGDYGRANLSPI